MTDPKYASLPELARAMGISVSQIYRVKEGKRGINQKFIVGAIRAFPERRLDDLFYLEPKSNENCQADSQRQAEYVGKAG